MKQNFKLLFLGLFSFNLFSCSVSTNENTEVIKLKELGIVSKDSKKVLLAKVSDEDGASFSFNIKNPTQTNSFSTKANESGSTGKTASDISNYEVYLVKNSVTSGYPDGADPLGTDKVSGPFTINNTAPLTSQLITFTNVPSAGTDAYYVALRAKDSGGNDLIIDNNGRSSAWIGTTATTSLAVAVSTGNGIVIDSNLQVNSTNPLSVLPRLKGAVGAKIEANVTPQTGSNTLPAVVAN